MENPNLRRSLSKTIYSMTRRYGSPASISKRTSNEVDYRTGQNTSETETASIRNCLQIPVTAERQVTYNASMMQSMRAFAWQGGQGYTSHETAFAILQRDIPNWGDIDPAQWITKDSVNYEVVEAVKMPGAWIVKAKAVSGARTGTELSTSDDTDLSQEAT